MLSLKSIQKKVKKKANKAKKSKLLSKPWVKNTLFSFLGLATVIFFYNAFFWGRIFPRVYVAGISIGGKSPQEAEAKIKENLNLPEKIVLTKNGETFEILVENIDFSYDSVSSVNSALYYTKTGNLLYDQFLRFSLLFKPKYLGLRIEIDENKLQESLLIIIDEVSDEAVYPYASFSKGVILIEKGKKGTRVDLEKLQADVEHELSFAKTTPIRLEKQEIDKTLSEEEALLFEERANKFLGKKITLTFEYQSFALKEVDVLPLLDPYKEYSEEEILKLIETVAEDVNRDVQNSVFNFVGGRVTEFTPAKDGIEVKVDSLSDMVIGNLRTLESTEEDSISFEVPVDKTSPDVATEDVNDLGINKLIGRGTSRFVGSISSRIYNIGHASRVLNGILVPPGHVFSFNNSVGDVSELTGYKQAYIIKDGQTVLGDGGGLCQVSTTIFRAALDAGLPIIERRYHSYRVGYYEQDRPVGFDATVYSPTTDFRFKNDTPAHVLIQTTYNPRAATLVFEIYGTDDGRTSTMLNHAVWDIEEPPEDLYIDDPTLPTGQVKQIDYKSWGAKARFTYTVKRAGEVIYQKVFKSFYQPWQAKFLRGTGPIQ